MTAALAAALQRVWWAPRPAAPARLLQPLSALYGALARNRARRTVPQALPVPVVVVGNLVVGGAGKTPVVIALVRALQGAGWTPGVVSRGYGRRGGAGAPRAAGPDDAAADVGDEPLLIARRTAAPVWVGRRRVEAARALLAAHPRVDVIVADDGLQHRALPRCAEVLVFDERGAGNGLLLPAGPLREPLPAAPGPRQRVLYTGGAASTPLPGALATRQLRGAVPLAAWRQGRDDGVLPLAALRGRHLHAAAGIASPARFFDALRAAGLRREVHPLPDHHDFATLPWPAGCAEDVLVTEKDAVKLDLRRLGTTPVWVVPLDLDVPGSFTADVLALLPARAAGQAPPSAARTPSP